MYDIFYVSKGDVIEKDWEIVKKKYPTAQCISRVSSFEQIKSRAFTKMFWVMWDDLELTDSFNFSTYQATKWDNQYVHVFKNGDYYDGICLFPKNIRLSTKEFEHRFFVAKKEVNIIASTPKPYDVVMISYKEPNADKNYQQLTKLFPNAKRVHGVKGIHQAHIAAADLCSTDLFWAVDGDADVLENFNFYYHIPYYDFNAKNSVHVWQSKNPINDSVYGYGGIKLLPRKLTINMDSNKADMTTSISKSFISVKQISNITEFNTDPFSTWKSAFRECVKLSSRLISRQVDRETEERLKIWTTVGEDRPFGKFAIAGARLGKEYGEKHKYDLAELSKINDFDWLEQEFKKQHG